MTRAGEIQPAINERPIQRYALSLGSLRSSRVSNSRESRAIDDLHSKDLHTEMNRLALSPFPACWVPYGPLFACHSLSSLSMSLCGASGGG